MHPLSQDSESLHFYFLWFSMWSVQQRKVSLIKGEDCTYVWLWGWMFIGCCEELCCIILTLEEIFKCLMECRDFYPRLHTIVLTYKTLVNDAYILEEGYVWRTGKSSPSSLKSPQRSFLTRWLQFSIL